jgi:hypothetical protein
MGISNPVLDIQRAPDIYRAGLRRIGWGDVEIQVKDDPRCYSKTFASEIGHITISYQMSDDEQRAFTEAPGMNNAIYTFFGILADFFKAWSVYYLDPEHEAKFWGAV